MGMIDATASKPAEETAYGPTILPQVAPGEPVDVDDDKTIETKE